MMEAAADCISSVRLLQHKKVAVDAWCPPGVPLPAAEERGRGEFMAGIVRIDDEVIDTDFFIRTLKLTGQFEGLVEQLVREKLTVLAAKKQGLALPPEEIQERADQFRRIQGLHRAADMNHYLDTLGISLDEFEDFITEGLYHEKMMAQVCSAQAVEQYFKLNSPKFDSVDISHIVLDSEGKAKEMMSALAERCTRSSSSMRGMRRRSTRKPQSRCAACCRRNGWRRGRRSTSSKRARGARAAAGHARPS
jgi:hypothetical protein